MKTYQVQVGDNLSTIAKRFGVPVSAVTGYRSNNPNVIFPGETLSINDGTPATPAPVAPTAGPEITPDGMALVAPRGVPAAPAAQPTAPAAPAQPPAAPAGAGQPPAPQQPPAQPVAPSQPIQPPNPSVPTEPAPRTFQTPSGATVDESGRVVQAPVEQGLDSLLQQLADTRPDLADEVMNALGYDTGPTSMLKNYGLDSSLVAKGFETNPTQTLSALVKQVSDAVGLPDARASIEKITTEIENLQNERDDKIRKINDDPFTSASTKQTQVQLLNDQYEQKIANRTNRLTLLQKTYSDARQEAQFAVTTALGYYDKQRTFDQNQLKLYLDQVEKAQAAQKNLGFELSPGQVRYQLDPTTGEYKAIASLPATSSDLGGLSKDQRSYLNTIQDNARQDQNIKDFPAVRASFETARSAALKQSGAGDIVLMRMIAKITDPTTGVREEEFSTFASAQATLQKYGIQLTKQMWSGDRLTNDGRLALYQQAKDIYQQRLGAYENSVNFFDQQATNAGLPSGLVMPVYTAPTSSGGNSSSSGGWF